MNKSSMRGIFLSVALLFSIALISIPSDTYAQEINAESIGLEETTIIEFTNDSDEEINTFRIWLGADFNFNSFKTEKGWMGEKTPQGVIIFTSSESIKKGESVKFGVKTDNKNPGINWKAIDVKSTEQGIGKVLPKGLPDVVENTEIKQDQIPIDTGILSDSVFRIIPEKPNVGSSIRVTGDNFGALQEFDFYIDNSKIGSFETDENGHFMTTMKIPENHVDRVDFKIKDGKGEEVKKSIRIGEIENRITTDDIKLTVEGIPKISHRGDELEIFGTGKPNSAITAEIINPDDEIINTRIAETDSKGNWKLDEPIFVQLDAIFGKYSIKISDGRGELLKNWTIETDKVILIKPTKLLVPAGELMVFNGTAIPNSSIELILEDPQGDEIFSDIVETDESGFVNFEYQTTENVDKEGTWTLIATQEEHKELVYVGYDEPLSIPVNIKFDKLNYKSTETALITLTGKASNTLKLIIIDPSGKIKGGDIPIQLQSDGRGKHELELDGFNSGIYSAVIQRGSSQSNERFTVGLQIGSGDIEAKTIKEQYGPGEPILVIGNTNQNTLMTGILIDPNGKEWKKIEIPSNSKGQFKEEGFRVPSEGIPGKWTIKISSGPNLTTAEFEVSEIHTEGMIVMVEEGEKLPGIGETIVISVEGASESTVFVEIKNENGDIIEDSLRCSVTSNETCKVLFTISEEMVTGTYTVKAFDSKNSDEITFEVS